MSTKSSHRDALVVTLCVSTYNRPLALRLCLESILMQTRMPDEILIGDDGSTGDTKKVILDYTSKFNIPLKHAWHPDQGYRLAAARNNCFRMAIGDYIIQTDGDIILDERFVEDHIRFAKPKTFLCGNRSLIEFNLSRALEEQGVIKWDLLKRKLSDRKYSIRSLFLARLTYLLRRGVKQTRIVQGSNMSFWKRDLLIVNGYNEDFAGWGKEDVDIALRLCYAGVQIRFVRNAGICYHLEHVKSSVANFHSNVNLVNETKGSRIVHVKNGIQKLKPLGLE